MWYVYEYFCTWFIDCRFTIYACRLVHVCHSGKVKIKAFINFILKYINIQIKNNNKK